jgi:FkbM family methyltransferase
MAANSLPRRLVKRVLAPLLSDQSYAVLQAVAMGWDIRQGSWFEPELELLPLGIKAGETVLDIGANFGLYAYHMAKAVGPAGAVYSFEPLPFTQRTFSLIAKGLRFGDQVTLVRSGCAESAGKVTFTVPVTSTGAISAGLVHMGRQDDRDGKEQYVTTPQTKQVECTVVSVDAHLPDLKNVSFIKCDIEGADLFAMRGAVKTLERNHPTVVIEVTPWYLQGFGLTVDDVYGFFTARGYRCYRYDNGSPHGQGRPATKWPRLVETAAKDIVEDNWVFIHPERASRFASIMEKPSA